MKVYLHQETDWDGTTTIGIGTEEYVAREKAKMLTEAKEKQADSIAKTQLSIEEMKRERKVLVDHDEQQFLPILRELRKATKGMHGIDKTLEQKQALYDVEQKRKGILKEIDKCNDTIWHLNCQLERLNSYTDEQLLWIYFPHTSFEEFYVLE